MRRGECHSCDGLLDGYLGRELTIPRVSLDPPNPLYVSRLNGPVISYSYSYAAGGELRKAEWADGVRVRSMFDADHPDPMQFIPRIPQVAGEFR